MNLRQAAEMALEALEEINKLSVGEKAVCLPAEIDCAMEALRQALAQPEQESVCAHGVEKTKCGFCKQPEQEPVEYKEYTAPPKREWVGLTDEERHDVLEDATGDGGHVYYDTLFRTIEAKLKEKNHD